MSFVTRTPVLWVLFGLTVALTLAFSVCAPAVGGQFLDMVSAPEDTRALYDAMTPSERSVHFWLTGVLDTAYPLCFGLFFAGMAWRFFGKWGPLAAIPGFAVLVVDLTENTLQAITLSGAAYLLEPKVWITPLKFGLFYAAALIALVAAAIALYRLATQKRS